jgi:hypothetical protein
MTDSAVDQAQAAIDQLVQQSVNALDFTVELTFEGSMSFNPCNPFTCTASTVIRNTVRAQSRYLLGNQAVMMRGAIEMTLDGRRVANCPFNVAVKPNGTARVSCKANYSLPADGSTHRVAARPSVEAIGSSPVEVNFIRAQLRAEADRRKARAGGTSATQYACTAPKLGDAAGGPGTWKAVAGSAPPEATWPRFQEQVTGVKRGNVYTYGGRDFDGFRVDAGSPVFMQATSGGLAWRLAALGLKDQNSTVVDVGMGVAAQERAKETSSDLLTQLRSEIGAVGSTANVKVEWTFGEQEAMTKMRAYAEQNLTAADFDKVVWTYVAQDYAFTGCK